MIQVYSMDGFQGAWLHFWRAKSVSGFSAAVRKIQGSKCYINSLPLVLKDKRSRSPQGERSAVQCVCPPEVRRLIDIWSIGQAHPK